MNRIGNQAKAAYKKVTHVIFDLDGLLLDTESIYKRVFANIAKTYGKEYTPDIEDKVKGRLEQDSAVVAVKEMQLPISSDEFLQKYKSMAESSLANVAFMSGAEKLVRHLYQQKVPIAVATSSSRESYELKISTHKDLFSLFNHVVTAGSDPEVKSGKPSPDVFLVCASRFKDKPNPEQCLVFEDAPNGVAAALSAGMQVVMVPDKATDPKLCEKATLKLDSLEDVQLELFGLPPFN